MILFRLFLVAIATSTCALATPEGFEIHTFAAPFDVDYPTAITVAPHGDVYVSSDPNGSLGKAKGMGRVIRCRDTDKDGKADEFTHFVPTVDSPRGGHIVGDSLYLVHPPYLSRYRDGDGDGVAEEHQVLVSGLGGGIEHPRGADHTTNGVRMGIDGWLYISVGDFGATPAKGTDGSSVKLHGGGVLRVRPDGRELEAYATMVRNICDTAISPTLDLFSRDNTNDGKGWNTRLHHHTALADHGYPRLYQQFADEAIAPLADYGGGSGTGALWVSEPGLPGNFGNMLYTCDWTTGNVYYHPHQQVGASYEIQQEIFAEVTHATDIDVDGSSRLYISDWRGGRFKYAGEGIAVGLIQQVTATGNPSAHYRDPSRATDAELLQLLDSPSAVQRFAAQQEILKRPGPEDFANHVLKHALDPELATEARIAAIFTYKQLLGPRATEGLNELLEDPTVREYALRAMTDRISQLDEVPTEPYQSGINDANPRVVLQSLIGLQRLQAPGVSPSIIAASTRWNEPGCSPRLRHTAVQVLASLGDIPSLLEGVKVPASRQVCLRALALLHEPRVVDGLADLAKHTDDKDLHFDILVTLARLHFQEAEWDGVSWWGTRPDDRGPYFQPTEWKQSSKIRSIIEQEFSKVPRPRQGELLSALSTQRMAITRLNLQGIDPLITALNTQQPDQAQVKLLVEAAKNPQVPFPRRFKCYQAILRLPANQNLAPRIDILGDWASEHNMPAEAAQHIDDFVNEAARAQELESLRTIAATSNDAVSTIAWKAILTVISSPLAKQDVKDAAMALTKPTPREVGFFHALAELKLSGFEKHIEAGMKWDNDELIAAAIQAKQATTSHQTTGKKVGEMPSTEVMDMILNSAGKGDLEEGRHLFTSQGCIACHAIDPNAVQKGPELSNAGSKFTRGHLVESILDPNADVAQGFQTTLLSTNHGKMHVGFITGESDGIIEMRDISGQASQIQRADVQNEQHLPQSMMPAGLAAGLTVGQLNSLIDFLESMKSN